MSIIGAMYSGVSGLDANSTMMEIIGNNLANINTPGFKFSRADFADILSKTESGGTVSVGRGVEIVSSSMLFAQGGFQSTENVTDLALSGKGFFMVNDPATTANYYTRAGDFEIDENGYLATASGLRVQGYQLTDLGNAAGVPRDILIPSTPLQPQITENVSLYANVSSQAEIVGPFDVNDATNTSNFTSSITVYDSLGGAHQVTVYFTREATATGANSVWTYNVVVDADDATSGVDEVGHSGELEFDSTGALVEVRPDATNAFNFVGGPTQNQIIEFDFGTSINAGGSGVDGTTSFGEDSALVYASQDGYGTSFIDSISIDSDGKVTLQYANGESRDLAQLAIANFSNTGALDSVGSNLFAATTASGEPIVSTANVSGNGSIASNTLELSNVDIAAQFVSMITTQRAYQANSRTITTSDTMISELLNLTR